MKALHLNESNGIVAHRTTVGFRTLLAEAKQLMCHIRLVGFFCETPRHFCTALINVAVESVAKRQHRLRNGNTGCEMATPVAKTTHGRGGFSIRARMIVTFERLTAFLKYPTFRLWPLDIATSFIILSPAQRKKEVTARDLSEWRSIAATENGFTEPYLDGDADLDRTVNPFSGETG